MVREDALQADPTAGHQVPIEGLEVGGRPRPGNRLDHLDADDGIKAACPLPVVLHADLDSSVESGGCNPVAGQGDLLVGQGDRGYLVAPSGRPDGQLAPARPDFQ